MMPLGFVSPWRKTWAQETFSSSPQHFSNAKVWDDSPLHEIFWARIPGETKGGFKFEMVEMS